MRKRGLKLLTSLLNQIKSRKLGILLYIKNGDGKVKTVSLCMASEFAVVYEYVGIKHNRTSRLL